MANKNVYEVFEQFRKATTKEERISVLRDNDCFALRNILMGAFHPLVEFTVTKVPDFKREPVPAGMSYSHMTDALSRVYLFTKGNPRIPPTLTEKRKTEILIQILESLEEKEADVFASMLMKDLKIPYLTPKLINEAFEGLLPKT